MTVALLVLMGIWLMVTTLVQAIQCPRMTTTELMLNTPRSVMGEFRICSE